jgi:hypothetical protein
MLGSSDILGQFKQHFSHHEEHQLLLKQTSKELFFL